MDLRVCPAAARTRLDRGSQRCDRIPLGGEGRNERYAQIAAEFVRLKVDVIVTSGGAAAVPMLARAPADSTNFEVGNQVLISSHDRIEIQEKLLYAYAYTLSRCDRKVRRRKVVVQGAAHCAVT
jgi:hypothetical protein